MVPKPGSGTVMIVGALALSGCGGGGGGDGGNIQVGAGLATIDSQSAPLIAEQVAGAIVASQGVATIGGFSVPSVSTSFASLGSGAPPMLAATVGPETVNCSASGSVTLSGTVAVPASLTPGDTLRFEFSDCDNAAGIVVDGVLAFEFVAFSGDVAQGMFTLTVSMTLEQLQFLENGEGGSIDGDLSFTVDTTNAPESFVAVSANAFSIAAAGESSTLEDFIMTIAVDPTLGMTTLDSSATVGGTAVDGEFSYVTTESLVFSDQGGPDTGQLFVTGAGSATLTINILSADQIELEIDFDGNETVDEVIVTSWAELTG